MGVFDAPFWCFYVAPLVMVPSMFYEFWAEEKEARKAEEDPPQPREQGHAEDAPGRAVRPGAR